MDVYFLISMNLRAIASDAHIWCFQKRNSPQKSQFIEAQQLTLDGVSRYFETGLYSDLRIKDSNGREYAVHRNIVCGQSPVLANACKTEHGFKVS